MNRSKPWLGCIFGTLYLLSVVCCLLLMTPAPAFSEENKAEEYKFEVSETEKKPYNLRRLY